MVFYHDVPIIHDHSLPNDITLLKSVFKEFELEQIIGGVTNQIYLIRSTNKSYILRIYSESDLFDRENELKTSTILGSKNVAPKIYMIYLNARIEEFYDGITLDKIVNKNADNMFILIAKTIKELHKTTYSDTLLLETTSWSVIEHIKKFRNMQNVKDILNHYYPNIYHDIQLSIKKAINTIDNNHLVWCHNDLHHGNMIYIDNDEVKFIDFEYFGKNPLYYDIANYFNELCTVECCWDKYPNYEKRVQFYEIYMNKKLNDDEIKDIDYKVYLCSQLGHLKWGLWALVQLNSQIEFDYMAYFRNRIRRYYDHHFKY